MKFPLAFAIVVEVLSSLQIFNITLSPTFAIDVVKTFTFSGWTWKITLYAGTIDTTDSSISDYTIQIIWYVLMAYLILHVSAFILMLIFQIKRITYKVDLFFRVMGIGYILHSRLLFFVLHYFFAGIIWSYVEYHDDDLMNSAFYYQQPFLAVTILACCVNIVIGFWVELSLYNVNKSKNDYAIQSNFFHQGVLLHKTVAIVCHFLFLSRGSVSIIEGIVHMLFTCSSIYTIYTRLPFYKTILLKTRIVLLALTLASSTILLVKEFSVKSIYLEVPWLMLSLLLIKISLIAIEILFKDILQGKFDTPEKAIHFAILIKQTNFGFISPAVHRRYFLNGTLLSSGFLKNQKVKLDSKNKDLKEYDRTVYKYLMNRLTLVLNKRRKSVPLVLFMAKIYLKKLENIPYVIGLLKRVNEQSLSTPLRNSVDEFSNTLERLYFDQHQSQKEKGDDELNLISYFKYRELAISLKENIMSETKMHLELWQELKTEKIEVKKLMDLAYEIDRMYHLNSSKFYQNLPEFSKHIANSLLVYRAYTEVVREIPVEARKLMRKFITIRHNYVLRHPLDVYSDEKAVLVLSLQKDQVGNIIDASGSAQTFFQIEKTKFLGEQLTSLIPSVLIKSHLLFIQNYAKNLDQKMDYQFNTFAKTSEKDLFELSVHITLYPEIDKEPKLMMFCQKIAPAMPIIIVDNDGQIVEFSKSVKETLINEEINIGTRLRRISAEYDVINTAFNIVYNPNNAEQIEENKKLVKKRTTKSRSSQLSGSIVSVKHLINQNATKSSYDRESVDADRAVDICNNYISGNKLTFNATAKKPEMAYDVQIEPFILEDQTFKVITLKYEDNNVQQVVQQSPLGIVEIEMENSEILTDIFPEDFPEEDEGKYADINSPSKIHHLASKGQTLKQGDTTLMSKLTLGIPNERLDREMSLVTKSTLQRASLRGSESFTKGMKTITKSAELAEKPKVSLSVDEPQKALPVQHEMSVTSYATGSVEAIKALRLIFDQKSTYPLRTNSIMVIGFLMICMIALTVVFYIFSKNAISEHDKNIQIINVAGERLAAGIKTWQYSIRYMLSQAGWSGEDLTSIESNIATTSLSMLSQGSELSQLASQTLAQSRLEDIYQENIEFWEPCMNLRTNDKPLNTFVASDLLYNKFISYSEPLQTCTNINITDNILYVVNNTGNDYLVSNEELGTVTQGILDSNVSTSTLNLEIILIFESITLVALGLYLIFAVRSIIQSYKRLFRALLRLDVTQISNRVLQLQLALKSIEIDIEDTKFGADTFASIQEIKPSLKEFSKGKGKQQRQRFAASEDTFSVRILQIYIVKYVAGTIIFILVPIILFYVSLLKSISNFGSLDFIDSQLSLTTKSEYNSRLLMNNFYLLMYFQNESSILIRNEDLMDQLTLNLDTINSLHSQMLSVFFENQNYTPDQTVLSMMTDTVCNFLPTTDPTVTENCPVATEGNTIGLLSMDANFISTTSTHITDYLNNPTAAYAIDQLDTYQSDVNALMITLEAAFSFLNTHILASAQTEIRTFDNATTGLFVGILLAVFLAIIMINHLGIKTFSKVDMGRGKILKLIPYQILKDNKVLDAYLNKDFKKKKFAIK